MVVGRVTSGNVRGVHARQIVCTDPVLIGIGNLYKTEMCFLLGIPPWVPVDDIDADAVVALARWLLLSNADRPEQSTGELTRGRQHWVYERGGRPCRRCGASDPLCAGSRRLRQEHLLLPALPARPPRRSRESGVADRAHGGPVTSTVLPTTLLDDEIYGLRVVAGDA